MIAFNNNTQVLCRYEEICRKNKTALTVYFRLPLSIFIFQSGNVLVIEIIFQT